jgi:hypothetical protein
MVILLALVGILMLLIAPTPEPLKSDSISVTDTLTRIGFALLGTIALIPFLILGLRLFYGKPEKNKQPNLTL